MNLWMNLKRALHLFVSKILLNRANKKIQAYSVKKMCFTTRREIQDLRLPNADVIYVKVKIYRADYSIPTKWFDGVV